MDPQTTANSRSILDRAGFFEKQLRADELVLSSKYLLYGGSRGPGKSYFLRWEGLRLLERLYREFGIFGARIMLGSSTYPTLKDRQIVKIPKEFAGLGRYNKTDKEFELLPEFGGGSLCFRNLDNPDKYIGSEWAGILIDEITENPFSVFDKLRGSMRWPGLPDEEVKFIAASNPTGISKRQYRELFIEKKMPPELVGYEDQFAYLPALPGDNPYLDEGYWTMLNTLGEPLRSAWLRGDWYVSFEGLVYSNFSQENMLEPEWKPDPELEIELGFDDGYVDPRAFLFIQKTGSEAYIFDEIYVRKELPEASVRRVLDRMIEHFGSQLDEDEEPLLDEDDEEIPALMPAIAVGSPEAKVLCERLRRANIPVRKPGIKSVIEGISHTRELFEDGQGFRTLRIHPRCTNLISELTEGYIYPEEGSRKDEEKPIDGNDHACEALRYWATARFKRRE